MRKFDHGIARTMLQWCICVSAVGTVGTLFYVGRDGAIGSENMGIMGQLLADLYLPLIGVMIGFYFSERAAPSGNISIAGFVLAAAVIAIWLAIPVLLLALPQFAIEDVTSYLRESGPYGESLVAGALTFYFSRESQTAPSPTPPSLGSAPAVE